MVYLYWTLGWVTINSLRPSDAYICVGKLTIIGSDNGLSPERRQAIMWTNAGILLIRPLGKNLSEILIEIYIFSLKKIHLKSCLEIAAILSRPQWVNNNVDCEIMLLHVLPGPFFKCQLQ